MSPEEYAARVRELQLRDAADNLQGSQDAMFNAPADVQIPEDRRYKSPVEQPEGVDPEGWTRDHYQDEPENVIFGTEASNSNGQRGPMLGFGVEEQPAPLSFEPEVIVTPQEVRAAAARAEYLKQPLVTRQDVSDGADKVGGYARKVLDLHKKGMGLGIDAAKKLNPQDVALALSPMGPIAAVGNAALRKTNEAFPVKGPPGPADVPVEDRVQKPPSDGKAPDDAPARTDAPAEPEMATHAAPQGSYTIGAHYEDQIGPEAWARLSDSEKATFQAADNIHNRLRGEADGNKAVADQQVGEAEQREGQAETNAFLVQNQRNDIEKQGADILSDAANLANYHEDPDRFWNSRSTPQKVAGFIGIALGGFVSGMKGGSNQVVDMIDKEIDRDIAAQRNNWRANKDSLEAKRSAYGMAMEKYNHDDVAARAALRLASLDKVEAQARSAAASHAGTEADNRLDLLLADTSKLRAEQVIAYKKYRQAQTVQTGGDGLTAAQRFQAVEKEKDRQLEREKFGATREEHRATAAEKQAEQAGKSTVVIDGKNHVALSEDAAKKYREYAHVRGLAREALNELELTKKGGKEENVARYQSAQKRFQESFNPLIGFGRAPTEGQLHDTLGTNFIPDFVHFGGTTGVGVTSSGLALTSRADDKIAALRAAFTTLDKDIREQTLGAGPPAPEGPPKYVPATGKKLGVK